MSNESDIQKAQFCFTAKMLEDVFEYIDLRVRQIQLANDYDLVYCEAALDMKRVLMNHSKRFYTGLPFVYPAKAIASD